MSTHIDRCFEPRCTWYVHHNPLHLRRASLNADCGLHVPEGPLLDKLVEQNAELLSVKSLLRQEEDSISSLHGSIERIEQQIQAEEAMLQGKISDQQLQRIIESSQLQDTLCEVDKSGQPPVNQ